MAHGITETDKGVVARVGAWHGLFSVSADFMTAAEAFMLAGLDWLVSLVSPTVTHPVTGDPITVDSIKLIQRQDNGDVFGAVTPGYAPIQNHTLRDAIAAIFGDTAKVIESAFSILGGRRVVMLVNLGAAKIALNIAGKVVEDAHDLYLMFATSHTGKGGWSVLPTAVRVVCQNTVRAAEGENGEILAREGITIRHSAKADDRIADAVKAYQDAVAAGQLTLKRIATVAAVRVKAASKRAYYRSIVDNTLSPVTDAQRTAAGSDPVKVKLLTARETKREELYATFLRWEAVEANTFTPGATEVDNAYLCFNAVSDAFEHDSFFRKSDGATAQENEFISRVYGKISDQKEEALLLLEAVIADPANLLDVDAPVYNATAEVIPTEALALLEA
jgi:hypothetical protein